MWIQKITLKKWILENLANQFNKPKNKKALLKSFMLNNIKKLTSLSIYFKAYKRTGC